MTADVPFYAFLGKAKVVFYSNDTRVLGVLPTRPKARSEGTGRPGQVEKTFESEDSNTLRSQFDFGEMNVDLLSFNYDQGSQGASQNPIPLLETSSGKITCEDCYLHAGENL